MKSVRYFGNGELRLVDVPEPQRLRPTDIKIKVAYCGVCGSDLHLKRAEFDFLADRPGGMPMGHEATGTIVEMGEGATTKGLKIGDRVTFYFNEHCGSCYYCRNGQEQFCDHKTVVSGAMSEYIVVGEQAVYKLPDSVSFQKGSLVEPISVCLHGIDLCSIRPGNTVAISGGGAMGMILSQLALRSGATKLTVFEPIAAKREVLKKLGVSHTVDPVQEDRVETAMKITEGRGFDVVIEASGNVKACDGLEELVAMGGTLEFFAAMYQPDYEYHINLFKAFMREIKIISGVLQSPYAFPRSIALAEVLDLDTLLVDGCEFAPEDCEQAFQAQMGGKTIKSLLRFSETV